MGIRKALAVLDCSVELDGTLTACSVIAESPPDFGFGEAAKKMAQRHVMTTDPVLVDGKPVAGHVVRLSVPFHITPGSCH
jgi:protein TonB